MKELKQITVIGLGLLGASITTKVMRSFNNLNAVGFSHRPSTRQKARQLAVAHHIADTLEDSVKNSDLVILATPICTFDEIFKQIAGALPKGCIVTDVGSTKLLPHLWAKKSLPSHVHYVGSHPVAGSEQRGLEFSRDDLFDRSVCILTKDKNTDPAALKIVKKFWSDMGCHIKIMSPTQHDKILGFVSHLPHLAAAALVNANDPELLQFAGKGFIDTTRIASGPANIWADILTTNPKNCAAGIDKLITQLQKLKTAIRKTDKKQIEKLLDSARNKRGQMIQFKIKNKELIP